MSRLRTSTSAEQKELEVSTSNVSIINIAATTRLPLHWGEPSVVDAVPFHAITSFSPSSGTARGKNWLYSRQFELNTFTLPVAPPWRQTHRQNLKANQIFDHFLDSPPALTDRITSIFSCDTLDHHRGVSQDRSVWFFLALFIDAVLLIFQSFPFTPSLVCFLLFKVVSLVCQHKVSCHRKKGKNMWVYFYFSHSRVCIALHTHFFLFPPALCVLLMLLFFLRLNFDRQIIYWLSNHQIRIQI